jgi:hypothetical protein
MAPHYLKLSYLPDDEYTCGFTGEVKEHSFAGTGEGWFSTAQVEEFVDALERFSKTLSGSAELAGGFWKDGQLEQVNLAMHFHVVSPNGLIGALVELAKKPHDGDWKVSTNRVKVALRANPQQLDRFINELKAMLQRKGGEAVLEAN